MRDKRIGLTLLRSKQISIEPINIGIGTHKKGHLLLSHRHQFSEVHYVESGALVVKIKKRKYQVKTGDVFYIAPEDSHYQYYLQDSIVYYFSFGISVWNIHETWSSEQLSHQQMLLLKQFPFFRSAALHAPQLRKPLNAYFTLMEKGERRNERKASRYLWEFLFMLAEKLEDKERRDVTQERRTGITTSLQSHPGIHTAVRYMEENFPQKVHLDTLARIAYMSRRKFTATFRHLMKSSPMEYYAQLRLNRAIELLRESDTKIENVARELGFENTSYFYTFFKNRTHQTPDEFRSRAALK